MKGEMELKSAEEVISIFEKQILSGEDIYFRGYTNYKTHMKPRLGRDTCDEFQLLNNYYQSHKKNKFSECIDVIEHAQHHQIQTRLLDWSESPLVALYFANARSVGSNNKKTYVAKINTKFPNFKDISEISIPLVGIDCLVFADIDNLKLHELETYCLRSNAHFFSSIGFKHLYDKFISSIPDDIHLVKRHTKKMINIRKYLQKGLFTFHKDVRKPFNKKYFCEYCLDLSNSERKLLIDKLSDIYDVNEESLGLS